MIQRRAFQKSLFTIVKKDMSGKRNLIFPYCLCALLVCTVVGLLVWPRINKQQMSKRHVDDESASVTEAPSVKSQLTGAIYVIWGRSTCPNQANLVYRGTAGGGYFAFYGSPTNIQCLPHNPTWGKYNEAWATTSGARSYIYGVEYNTPNSDFPFSHDNARALINHNLPCAVCTSKRRSTHLMIPGRAECVDGWHLEYAGYLMAGDFKQAGSSEYVCVDNNPEADPAGYRKEDSHHLSVVEVRCGSIPCPPYIQGREMTCSVCTK